MRKRLARDGRGVQNMSMTGKKRRRTTVVLSDRAHAILLRYRAGFRLRDVIGVGLQLFDELPETEKLRRIMSSNEAESVADAAQADAQVLRKRRRRSRK